MRRAFVFQLSSTATGERFEGRIEHVDSGRSGHFHSVDEAMCFVHQVLADIEATDEAPLEEALNIQESNN